MATQLKYTMIKRRILLILIGLLVSICDVSSMKVNGDKDLEFLRNRFIAQLLDSEVNEAHIRNILTTFRNDSIWPGIDYSDVSRTGFQHSVHLDNLVQLCHAYRKRGSPFYDEQHVGKVVNEALDFWLKNDFICENWWWNKIGTPKAMVSIMLMMDSELTPGQVSKILSIAGRANLNSYSEGGARPGGDKILIAGLLAKTALFNRDVELFKNTINVIEEEIKFTTKRGMQYDYSFHHREDRVNNSTSYGMAYANVFAEWAENVADTKFHFSKRYLDILVDYYLDGICKQMVYGRSIDPGVLNRDITRPGSGKNLSTDPLDRLLKVSSHRKEELENIIKIRKSEKSTPVSFAKFFWQSEHFVFQRPTYFTSVRMYSTRNSNMELPHNSEGLMNHYRGDGTNYLSVRGGEYLDLAPIYDWMKIPGATTMQTKEMPSEKEIQKRGLTGFVGGVTNGKYGAAVFDFESPHHPLVAKKAYFFFDDEYVCLGSGIDSETDNNVVTTLNQCHLGSDVIVNTDTGSQIMSHGNYMLGKVDWVFHDGVGYLFPEKTDIHLSNEKATGTWYRVNKQKSSSKKEITGDIFKLWVDHGSRLRGAGYQYIVFPSVQKSFLENYKANPSVSIVSNTPDLQCVRHKGLNLTYLVFYQEGSIGLPDGLTVEADSPGLIMIHEKKDKCLEISVSDPSRTLSKLTFFVNRKISSESDHYCVVWHANKAMSEIEVNLPKGPYMGKSRTLQLF